MGRSRLPARTWLLAALAWGTVAACEDPAPVIRGAEGIVQERRALAPVDLMVIQGASDVSIRVVGVEGLPESSGRETIVWVEGAGDLLGYIETTLHGGELRIAVRDGVRLDPVPALEIQVARLRGLTVLGSGQVRADGIGVEHQGRERGGEATFTVESVGSADIHLSGSIGRLVARQSGSGDLHLGGLLAKEVDHAGLGRGDAWVSASDRVSSKIRGSGDLHVIGDATLATDVSGSGKVLRQD